MDSSREAREVEVAGDSVPLYEDNSGGGQSFGRRRTRSPRACERCISEADGSGVYSERLAIPPANHIRSLRGYVAPCIS